MQQIYKAQKFDFNFLPMNLSLYHDIYDKSVDSLINGKDVVIAKQLQGMLLYDVVINKQLRMVLLLYKRV